MVLEVAVFDITPGKQDAFAAVFPQARTFLDGSPGLRSLRMTQGIETPTRFVLLVEWDSLAEHEQFRASEAFPQWRALISPHFAGPPQVEHYDDL